MEQHPIPQQISSYQFKLVGEMTLAQFLKAAGGIVLAIIINATGVVFFVRWPLMLVSGLGGLALAFVPFEDRPLETWVKAFIKSIYAPTIYIYKKHNDFVLPEFQPKYDQEEPKEEEETKDESKIAEFISTLPSVKKEIKLKLEETEEKPGKEVKEPIIAKDKVKDEIKADEVVETTTEKEADWRTEEANLNLKKERLIATGEAHFGEIPMPNIPDIPNVVVGMVTDSQGKIIEGAIIEIQDVNGNPARVLKTNQLGQFRTSTQLSNGKYLMVTEKEGFDFDRVDINLSGQIVEPIKIEAKGAIA